MIKIYIDILSSPNVLNLRSTLIIFEETTGKCRHAKDIAAVTRD